MFMGTPDFAVPSLRAVAAGCDVVRVVTQPDRPRGRGRVTSESPVAVAAGELALTVMRPADMRAAEVRDELALLGAEAFAVVAFGAILTPELLRVPRAGCINLHGSLLPHYRGAAPVQRAIWDGRTHTGVCTLFMDEGIDTGDVIECRAEPIHDDDDAGSLATRLAAIGGPLLRDSVLRAVGGEAPRKRQDPSAGSYAKKLKKEDGIVDWRLAARTVWTRARAVTPWPGATTAFRGKRVLIVRSRPEALELRAEPGTLLDWDDDGVRVACAEGALRVTHIKPEGRAELAAAEWARGARPRSGERFEDLKEKEQTT